MCMCMRMRMRMCMWYVHVCVRVCVCVCAGVCVCACMCAYVYVYIYIYICMYRCTSDFCVYTLWSIDPYFVQAATAKPDDSIRRKKRRSAIGFRHLSRDGFLDCYTMIFGETMLNRYGFKACRA